MANKKDTKEVTGDSLDELMAVQPQAPEPVSAPSVVVNRGPELVALNEIRGLGARGNVIPARQKFYCSDEQERNRLIKLGAARLLSEVLQDIKTIRPE